MSVFQPALTELRYSMTNHGHLIIGLNFIDEKKSKVDSEFATKYYNFCHHIDLDQRNNNNIPVQLHMTRSVLTNI